MTNLANDPISHFATVPATLAMQRLDRAASELFPQFSRSRLQAWIKSGELTVDGELRRSKDKVLGGEELEIEAQREQSGVSAEAVPFNIVYEDEDVLVVDKHAGLVVHPGAGNPSGTLMNGLLHHAPSLSGVPRAGIVHRLDKETTGLMVVAKTLESQNHLVQQLQAREVRRIYEAIVYGVVQTPGQVNAAIARDPAHRTRMAVRLDGKAAVTHYRILHRFDSHTLVELVLETGRTHQIRVHMQHLGFPLVGDTVYGGTFRMPRGANEELVMVLRGFGRQALHARRLGFVHPSTGEAVQYVSALPTDMSDLLVSLEQAQ